MEGTVTIGIDYYSRLVEDNAALKERFEALKRYLDADGSRVVYSSDVKRIVGLICEESVTE